MKAPAILDEFYRTFSSEPCCGELLRRLRGPNGFRCSRCEDAVDRAPELPERSCDVVRRLPALPYLPEFLLLRRREPPSFHSCHLHHLLTYEGKQKMLRRPIEPTTNSVNDSQGEGGASPASEKSPSLGSACTIAAGGPGICEVTSALRSDTRGSEVFTHRQKRILGRRVTLGEEREQERW
jgi:hypothetical protein